MEFNLVYHRGTRFGLETPREQRGNPDILPPLARWGFDVRPEPDSAEMNLARFLQPHDWAAYEAAYISQSRPTS